MRNIRRNLWRGFGEIRNVILGFLFLRAQWQEREQDERSQGQNPSAHKLPIVLTLTEPGCFCNKKRSYCRYARNSHKRTWRGRDTECSLSAKERGRDCRRDNRRDTGATKSYAANTCCTAISPERTQSGTPIPR